MILKRTMSAVIAVAAAASTMVCFAASANAAETTLSYVKDGVALSSYTYNADSTDIYTLNAEGTALLSNAKDGDTLTITYNIESAGTARYRAGLNIAGKQFYVNCHDEAASEAWSEKNNYHLTVIMDKNDSVKQSAAIKYVITLNEGGTASSVTAYRTDGRGEVGKSTIDLNNADIRSLELNTDDRGGTKDQMFPKLTNFSAVLTTADPEEPSEPVVIAADPYTYETDDTLANADAKGFTATVDGEEGVSKAVTWYASIDGGSEWKELEGDSTIVTGGSAKFGVILFDIPKEATDVKAGYVFE